MARAQYGRHLPAFLLLFLAQESAHGTKLLAQMAEHLTGDYIDGPAVYRALNELERTGAVTAKWDTDAPGAAKKCYQITQAGYDLLETYTSDIEARVSNLTYFLSEAAKLQAPLTKED